LLSPSPLKRKGFGQVSVSNFEDAESGGSSSNQNRKYDENAQSQHLKQIEEFGTLLDKALADQDVLVNEQNQTIIKLKAELQEAKDDTNRELLE
jgi:hypothetical protein